MIGDNKISLKKTIPIIISMILLMGCLVVPCTAFDAEFYNVEDGYMCYSQFPSEYGHYYIYYQYENNQFYHVSPETKDAFIFSGSIMRGWITPDATQMNEFHETTYCTRAYDPAYVADFEISPDFGGVPLLVNLTSISTPLSEVDNYTWDIDVGGSPIEGEDGTIQVQYTEPGEYNIVMTAYWSNGYELMATHTLTLDTGLPTLSWFATPVRGYVPFLVDLVSTDTGGGFTISSWGWQVQRPNGSWVSQEELGNTARTNFTAYEYGNYTITHSATTPGGTVNNTEVYLMYEGTSYPPVVESVSASPLTGNASVTVTYTVTATNSPTHYLFKFDSESETEQHTATKSKTWTTPGLHTLRVRAQNAAGYSGNYYKYYTVGNASNFGSIPDADFTWHDESTTHTVHFQSLTTGDPMWYDLYFGDGDSLLNAVDIGYTHHYPAYGTYTATLTAYNAAGSDTISHDILVHSQTIPTGFYNVTPSSGEAPLTVNFVSSSTESPDKYYWDFDTGGAEFTETEYGSVQMTYSSPGVYHTRMIAQNGAGNSSIIAHTVTVYGGLPTLSYYGTPNEGTVPFKVYLYSYDTDGGSAITSRAWGAKDPSGNWLNNASFGTGTTANFTADEYGTWQIYHSATNGNGMAWDLQDMEIENASTLEIPEAYFVADPMTGTVPITVTFTSASTHNPTEYTWDLDVGGSPIVTEDSQIWMNFDQPGTYHTSLIASNAAGDSAKFYRTIELTGGLPSIVFFASPTVGTVPFNVNLVSSDVSGGSTITARSWAVQEPGGTFLSNATLGTGVNAAFTANAYGIYHITHTATNSAGTASDTQEIEFSSDEANASYIQTFRVFDTTSMQRVPASMIWISDGQSGLGDITSGERNFTVKEGIKTAHATKTGYLSPGVTNFNPAADGETVNLFLDPLTDNESFTQIFRVFDTISMQRIPAADIFISTGQYGTGSITNGELTLNVVGGVWSVYATKTGYNATGNTFFNPSADGQTVNVFLEGAGGWNATPHNVSGYATIAPFATCGGECISREAYVDLIDGSVLSGYFMPVIGGVDYIGNSLLYLGLMITGFLTTPVTWITPVIKNLSGIFATTILVFTGGTNFLMSMVNSAIGCMPAGVQALVTMTLVYDIILQLVKGRYGNA